MSNKIYSFEEIRNFIVEKTGCEENEVTSDSDLMYDLGCSGDDFHELIEDYIKKYNVDMSTYLWYFHSDEEGHSHSIGRGFFKAPYEMVKHIPITPTLLLDSANQGKWLMIYPEHKLPKRRYDLMLNQIVILLFIIIVIHKCSH